ncbi:MULTISPECIES: biotin-dependent carboxyltransferase family protein [unclassified Cryobacterium]|uniref:5-oxoprolinase subunit C family protein n=1 Tax=unclassified Cryobacterium TaxID=2649013 RepID=UPI00106A820B|nr:MULTISPECIES: biotin-dependent carboxyltransferase family protein [unclassified Cryobacterium]TFD02746.1 biotin-dependent carboxyltransferase [Cryobacterium sp. TMT1-66-1]TFD11449.1 biotin-dependent carboxyltransferase [Cryobacterium sp. TMT1-2-2]
MAFDILEPGLSTTVQDQGRIGYYRFGIPQGGSMDQYSATLANRLVGNTAREAVLECTYIGPKLISTTDAIIAVTGAPVDVFVNGELVPEYERLELLAGNELKFGVIKGGTKYFIAVHGGIDVPEVLGSRSTYPIGAIGGVDGRALAAGDLVPVGAAIDNGLPALQFIEIKDRPAFSKDVTVRVMLGLYDHLLSHTGLDSLLNSEWVLTPVADRMGLRYSGPGVEWKDREQPFGAGQDPSNIVDAGYAVGSIQIPGGTQPIILHRDAVSGGGYAMVATVISADMDLVARCSPGTKTHFVAVTMEQALAARAANTVRAARIWS